MPKPSTTVTVETQAETLSNATLLDQIMAETKLVPTQEGYQVARQGVSAFIAEILKNNDPDQLINKHRVDQMIAELDRVLSKQMDAILHEPAFQQLESSWRSLKLLVDRTDFRENIKLEVLHVSKEDLLDDFENAADITCSGIYKHVYTAGYGQFGGEPVAAMVGNYNFGPSSPDIKLLSYMASVGAMSHAPFIAAPSPEFFNLSSFEALPNLKEIKDIFAGPPAPAASTASAQEQKPEPAYQGYPADPEFQLRGGCANLMLDAAAPLFGLVMRLRTLDELPNIKDVHQQVRIQIDSIREEIRQHGYEPAQLLAYSYGLCLYIDEAVMDRPWGKSSCWSHEPLLSIFHDETWGGEKIFTVITRLMQEPKRYQDVLEFMYFALAACAKASMPGVNTPTQRLKRTRIQ